MKRFRWLLPVYISLLLAACQTAKIPVTILADGRTQTLSATTRLPADLLKQVGVTLGAQDRLLYLGASVPLDTALPEANSYTLVVRRAVALTIVTPDGTQTLQSSAPSVGQALADAGFVLYATDRLDPPAETPLDGPLTVTYQPARELTVTVDGSTVRVRSAAGTVGQALAEAGIPLIGLDYAVPSESAPLPADGKIQVVRVIESVALTQKSIPFNTRTELSADLELDQKALIQGGEPGLSIARQRTRSEDGVQVAQQAESESIVRPARDAVTGIGTKIVIRTAVVDGVTIEYWRKLSLAVTSYSPCRSGTTKCMSGTSLGTPVRKGEVAMVYSWWLLLAHEGIYVPGYGAATIEDVGGGWPAGNHAWIDLGYPDSDYVGWSSWVTVYFLTPVPANIANMVIMP